MEDHKLSRTQPATDKEEKILDLTKDMELADQEKHKIFDLSDGMDQPEVLRKEESTSSPTPSSNDALAKESAPPAASEPAEDETPSKTEVSPPQPDEIPISEASKSQDTENIITDDSPVVTSAPIEEAVAPQETGSDAESPDQTDDPELTLDETVPMPDAPESDGAEEGKYNEDQIDDPDLAVDEKAPLPDAPESEDSEEEKHSIEEEVDAAFDEVQSEPPSTESQKDAGDQLFDKLSGITQMVDNAVRDIKEDDPPQDAPSEPDDATLTSDAAELEAAISGEEIEEEDIIELTDIVDPAEAAAAAELAEVDDDIIELVDIVDPAELEAETKETIGQTDDPTDLEIASNEVMEQDIAPAPEADEQPTPTEEDLALSDMDEFDPDDGADMDRDGEDDFDTTELDKLFDDNFLGEEKAAEDSGPSTENDADHDEEVILLTDVLKEGTGAKRTPAAGIMEDETTGEGLFEDPDVEADMPTSVSSPPDKKEQEDLSNLTIEAAVEHLLKTKYADTIQQMVADAVDKAVTREVENIKRGLSDKNEPKG